MAAIRNAEYLGASGIDLHLPNLAPEHRCVECIRKIVDCARVPVVVLNYDANMDEEERVALLLSGIEAGAAALDMQGYTFDRYSKERFRDEFSNGTPSFVRHKPKECVLDPSVIERQCELIERVHAAGAEVLLSNHTGVPFSAEEVVELALFVEKRKPDVIKIVTAAEREEDAAEAIRAMMLLKKEVKTPVSYHASGKYGMLTRIVNPALGGFMAFCNDGFTSASVLEQPDLATVKSVVEGMKKIIM